jgi:hypothetical protein
VTTNTRTGHKLASPITHLRNDLDHLADDLRWAYNDAWWPTATDPNAPSRRNTTNDDRPRPTSVDHLDAAPYDIGIGDHLSRAALETAITHLATIETRLARAVYEARTRHRQPALNQPGPHSSLPYIEITLIACSWRLTTLDHDTPQLDPRRIAAIRPHLNAARSAADSAVRALGRALNRGDTLGIANAEPKCRICGIRPRAERRTTNGATRASKGGRCDTCAQWHQRNGTERPRNLDRDAVADALDAARRRRTRGEGYGAA